MAESYKIAYPHVEMLLYILNDNATRAPQSDLQITVLAIFPFILVIESLVEYACLSS